MIQIKEDLAEVVLGDKDVQMIIRMEHGKTILEFTSLDEEQVVRVCMPEANLKTTLDNLNWFYYTRYFAKSVDEERERTLKAVEEFKRKKVQAVNKEE